MKISCIVPVYNVEKYIGKCLDSILNQSFKDFEVILIDDGSTDDSGKICDEYEKIDDRIKVIHKTNGGLSDARNTGIENAKGDYFIFIDSDDYIEENMFEILYNLNIDNNTEIAACDKAFVFEDTGKIEYGNETNTVHILNPEETFKIIVDFYKKLGMEMWNKLYSKKLFDNVRFPKGKNFEDQATQYKLIFLSNKISYIEKSMYYYLRRDNSITTQKYSDKEKQRFEMVNSMVNYIKQYHTDIVSEVVTYKILSSNLTIVNKMIKSNIYDEEFLKIVIKDTFNESKYLKKKSLKYIRRLQLFLLIYMWPIYKLMYKILYGKKKY